MPRIKLFGKTRIVVGDTTTHGGVVITGSATAKEDGIPVARKTDKVICPLCKPHVFVISEGFENCRDHGLPMAAEGHLTSCGARLVASAAGKLNLSGIKIADTVALAALLALQGETLSDVLTLEPTDSSAAAKKASEKTVLNSEVKALIDKSPTLEKNLQTLKEGGWEIEFGSAGGGSYAKRDKKLIVIDGNEEGHPEQVAQTLAHETGHALYSYAEDCSSRTAYVNGALSDEGEDTLTNIKVQREIIANGGPDIGIAGNPANHAAYNAAYDQALKDKNEVAAREKIGQIFGSGETTSNTGQAYEDYYGEWYDKKTWC
jgi:type VI secretion system secreted protein VgrG